MNSEVLIMDTASVCQLAFGVNTAIPFLISQYGSAAQDAAQLTANRIQVHVLDFHLEDKDRAAFQRFVMRSMPAFAIARRIRHWLTTLSVVILGASGFGLLWGPMAPNAVAPSSLFIGFSLVSLVASPLLYYCYGQWFSLIRHALRLSSMTPEKAQYLAQLFRIHMETTEDIKALKEVTLDSEHWLFQRRIRRVRRALAKAVNLRAIFRAYHTERLVRKNLAEEDEKASRGQTR